MGASLNKKRGSSNKRGLISFKILVVGPSQSGKTTIIQRYTTNRFRGDYVPTRLIELTTYKVKVLGRNLAPISVTFWEVPSNPLSSMREKYYSNADGVLVVGDATSTSFVKDVLSWKEDISSIGANPFIPFVLLANKMDWSELGEGEKTVAKLRKMSEENGFATCIEVSPHNGGESVFHAVDGLLRLLVDNGRYYQKDSFYPTSPNHSNLAITTRTLLDSILPMEVHLTGSQEQDSLLAMCWKEVAHVDHCFTALMKGVLNFERESLCESMVVGHVSAHQDKEGMVEHCIAGLRERLPSGCCELHVVCAGGSLETFPQLKITDKCLFKCGPEVLKLLYIYHTEIYPPGNHLLQNIPTVMSHIQNCKESLSKLKESTEQDLTQEATADNGSGDVIVDVMVELESWEKEIETALKKVKTLSQKVQVAALWNS